MNTTTNTQKTILDFLHFDNPTDQQKSALLGMEKFVEPDNKEDFLILSGAAGTGKTSITTALVGYLNNQNLSFEICAPTGRAARILGRKSNILSSTIHSLIFDINTETETGKVFCSIKKIKEPVTKPKIFIIDEASMIGTKINNNEDNLFQLNTGLLDAIILFIKRYHEDSKVIFLGDRNQLAPINEETSMALDKKFLETKYQLKGAEFILSEVMRQQKGSIIMENAIIARKAIDNNLLEAPIKAHNSLPSIYKSADSYVNNYKKNGPDTAIAIGCTHNANRFFNDMVRQRLYSKNVNMLEIGDYLLVTKTWERNGIKLYSGDHVVVEGFDKNGIVSIAGFDFMPIEIKATNIKGDSITICDYMRLDLLQLPTGNNLPKLENKLRQERYAKNPIFRESKLPQNDIYVGALALTYGHAITCNKAQGGEWNTVYLNTFKIPDMRWQYTAITRAQERLIVF